MSREDRIFRALADPTRRAVFERLTRREAPVLDLTRNFGVSQPAISQHLGVLRRAGLVRQRRDGRRAYYRVERSALRPLVGWIERYQAFWLGRLGQMRKLLEDLDP